MKGHIPPRIMLIKAMETYLGEAYNISIVINSDDYTEIRLKATAFGIKQMAAMYETYFDTEIDSNNKEIHIKKFEKIFYVIDDFKSSDIMLYAFNIICQYGYILKFIDEMDLQVSDKDMIQTKFSIVV